MNSLGRRLAGFVQPYQDCYERVIYDNIRYGTQGQLGIGGDVIGENHGRAAGGQEFITGILGPEVGPDPGAKDQEIEHAEQPQADPPRLQGLQQVVVVGG